MCQDGTALARACSCVCVRCHSPRLAVAAYLIPCDGRLRLSPLFPSRLWKEGGGGSGEVDGRMSRRNKEQRVNYHLFPLPPFKGEIKAALSCLLPPLNPPPGPPTHHHPSLHTRRPSPAAHQTSPVNLQSPLLPYRRSTYSSLVRRAHGQQGDAPLHRHTCTQTQGSDTCFPRCLLQVLCFLLCFVCACSPPASRLAIIVLCLVRPTPRTVSGLGLSFSSVRSTYKS